MSAFDAYWTALDEELESLPAAPELEPLPLRTTDFAMVYTVKLTSIGPYRMFGYLSVPRSGGPFPALLETPRYGSVNHVPAYELRQRYVVLTLMHRGQRLADQPFAAAYPGLLTLGIEDPVSYVYRGIVADCLRGAEFLLGYPDVDTRRVGIAGDDLALLTAARRPHFAAVQVTGFLLYRLLEAAALTQDYPVEEISDLLRTFPEKREAVSRTLDFFDPIKHATSVTAPTLVAAGDSSWAQPLVTALGSNAERYAVTHEGKTDHDYLDSWLADQLIGQPAHS